MTRPSSLTERTSGGPQSWWATSARRVVALPDRRHQRGDQQRVAVALDQGPFGVEQRRVALRLADRAGREGGADPLAEQRQLGNRILGVLGQPRRQRGQVVSHPLLVHGPHRQQRRLQQGGEAPGRARVHQRLA